jgi:hypothetical protein
LGWTESELTRCRKADKQKVPVAAETTMSLACDERGLIRTEPEDGVMVVKSFRLSFRTVTAAVVFAVVLATGIQWRIRADAEAKENALTPRNNSGR